MLMKYLLNESVIKGALEGDADCGEAIEAILRRCDSLVLNEEWCRKCLAEVQRQAHTTIGLRLLKVLNNAWVSRGKLVQVIDKPSALSDESDIHHKDLWLVRLAVASGACLVTEDGKLLEVLRRKGILCSDARAVVGG